MSKLLRKINERGSTTLTCDACGEQFTRPNAHIRGVTSACSKACSQKLKLRKPKTLIDCTCRACGKVFQIRKGRGGTGEYCSNNCRRAMAMPRGEAHPNWKGGSSKRSYASRKTINQLIIECGCCDECGVTTDLQGHHKNPHATHIPGRADPDNIQVLCRVCHAKKHPRLAAFILSGNIRA